LIEDHNSSTQFVKPQDNKSLEAGWGETIVPLPHGNYVWNISQSDGYV
jgi:hypothetical protein